MTHASTRETGATFVRFADPDWRCRSPRSAAQCPPRSSAATRCSCIATNAHRRLLEAQLDRAGADVHRARREQQYVYLNAIDSLSRVTIDRPHPTWCASRSDRLADQLSRRDSPRVWIFGDMVALMALTGIAPVDPALNGCGVSFKPPRGAPDIPLLRISAERLPRSVDAHRRSPPNTEAPIRSRVISDKVPAWTVYMPGYSSLTGVVLIRIGVRRRHTRIRPPRHCLLDRHVARAQRRVGTRTTRFRSCIGRRRQFDVVCVRRHHCEPV